jgi:hypothetical protein
MAQYHTRLAQLKSDIESSILSARALRKPVSTEGLAMALAELVKIVQDLEAQLDHLAQNTARPEHRSAGSVERPHEPASIHHAGGGGVTHDRRSGAV